MQIGNRSKRVLNSAHEFKIYFSSKPKVPNHYETLKVTQNSTQDDIKSSYYELSKKYHPDVNKSADAKKNFQDLSDAYEVLGNFNKRKLYDRDLVTRGASSMTGGVRKAQTYTHVEVDPLAGFYKSRQAQRDYDPQRESAANQAKFDFDQWTRAHYGTTLRRSLRDRSGKILKERLQQQYQYEREKSRAAVRTILTTTALIFIFLTIQSHFARRAYDRNLIANRKN